MDLLLDLDKLCAGVYLRICRLLSDGRVGARQAPQLQKRVQKLSKAAQSNYSVHFVNGPDVVVPSPNFSVDWSYERGGFVFNSLSDKKYFPLLCRLTIVRREQTNKIGVKAARSFIRYNRTFLVLLIIACIMCASKLTTRLIPT